MDPSQGEMPVSDKKLQTPLILKSSVASKKIPNNDL
jgi:hypothetical protein